MNYKVITFAKEAKSYNVGRGGLISACGIQVINYGTEVVLEGVNSRGKVGSTKIVVPKSEIDDLIATLTAMRNAPVPATEIVAGKYTVQIDGGITAAYDTEDDIDCDIEIAVARQQGSQILVYGPDGMLV